MVIVDPDKINNTEQKISNFSESLQNKEWNQDRITESLLGIDSCSLKNVATKEQVDNLSWKQFGEIIKSL